MSIKTLCEFCTFAKRTGDTQTGCELNRLDKFETELVGNNYVVKNYCGACRNQYWEHANKPMPEKINLVYKECQISYSILNVCDNFVENDMKIFRDMVLALDIKPTKVHVVLEFSEENAYKLLHFAKDYPKNFEFTMSKEKNTAGKIRSIIRKVKENYLCFAEMSSIINEDVIKAFNEASVIDCKPKTIFFGEDFCFCASVLYNHFMYSDTPFEDIIKYVSKNNDNNSEL